MGLIAPPPPITLFSWNFVSKIPTSNQNGRLSIHFHSLVLETFSVMTDLSTEFRGDLCFFFFLQTPFSGPRMSAFLKFIFFTFCRRVWNISPAIMWDSLLVSVCPHSVVLTTNKHVRAPKQPAENQTFDPFRPLAYFVVETQISRRRCSGDMAEF